MRIDAHQHFWRYNAERDAWITDDMRVIRRDFLPADLEPELEACAMGGCIAVQADQSLEETRFLLELAERNPFIGGVVGWVDLRSAGLRSELERLHGEKWLCGVRHIAQAEDDDFLTRAGVVRGIGMLQEFGLTYDILIHPRQLPAAIALVEQLPEQRFVVDHIAKPAIRTGELMPWARRIEEMAGHPNAWCKVSGLVTEADWQHWRPEQLRPYLDVVFGAFGPDRLMFGSDWPVCLLAASYADVYGVIEDYAADLPEREKAGLFGLNAARFYGLDP